MNTQAIPATAASAQRHPFPAPSTSLRSTRWWAGHFKANATRDRSIPWTNNPPLSPAEFARIAPSIAEFQRGESSEARNYLAKSAAFADAAGEPSFHEASRLFVREENHHAELLLRFMKGAGMPAQTAAFSDGVFRRIRSASDIGWSCRVLVIAEFVAQEYYPCLRDLSSHPVLKRVCEKLIHDEFAHIRFQVERIARVEAPRGLLVRSVRELLQTVLTAGACVVVWRNHRAVLAPLGFTGFLSRVLRRNHRAIVAIRRARQQTSDTAPAGNRLRAALPH